LELCRRLKQDDKTNHIPVILLTARGTIEHRLEGLESGADSYISKPFHPRHLEVRIRKLIESRQLLRDKLRAEILKNGPGLTNPIVNSGSALVEKAQKVIEENLKNPDFTFEMLSDALHLSYTQLYRKLKSISGLTIAEFILSLRLKKSCQLLIQNNHSISEVCYEVGFSSPSYFTKCFREQFNMTPTEYCEKYKGN
jgi:AraC-like DNA-binding protein